MKAENESELKKLDEAVEDAEKNLGETEVRDFMLKKAEYLSRIGDKVSRYLTIYSANVRQLAIGILATAWVAYRTVYIGKYISLASLFTRQIMTILMMMGHNSAPFLCSYRYGTNRNMEPTKF